MTMKNKKETKKHSFLPIFICIFVALVLIFGVVMGIVIGVSNARSAAKYGSINMSEGALRAYVSKYKSEYVAALIGGGVDFYEHESFWSSAADDGGSYGDYLKAAVEARVRETVVKAALFDEVGALSATDKNRINQACEEVLSDRAGGDEGEFNRLTAPYGFTYSDMKEMVTVVYKADRALEAIYGTNGAKVVYRTDGLCREFLSGYSHIYILFIRTEGYEGEDRAEREAAINTVRDAIAAKNEGGDFIMNGDMFFNYLNTLGDDTPENKLHGYYLREGSAYTAASLLEAPALTEKALDMEIGEFSEVEFDTGGVCFIYKCEPSPDAYLSASIVSGLSDFTALAAEYCFESDVAAFTESVVLTEKYYAADPTKIKYTGEFYPIT